QGVTDSCAASLSLQGSRLRKIEVVTIDCRNLAAQLSVITDFPHESGYRADLATSLNNLGSVLLMQRLRLKEAEAVCREALAVLEELAEEFFDVPSYSHDLAKSYHNLANLLRHTYRPKEAEAAGQAALARYERLSVRYPKAAKYQHGLADTIFQLALLARDRKDFSHARELLERADSHYKTALAANSYSAA